LNKFLILIITIEYSLRKIEFFLEFNRKKKKTKRKSNQLFACYLNDLVAWWIEMFTIAKKQICPEKRGKLTCYDFVDWDLCFIFFFLLSTKNLYKYNFTALLSLWITVILNIIKFVLCQSGSLVCSMFFTLYKLVQSLSFCSKFTFKIY